MYKTMKRALAAIQTSSIDESDDGKCNKVDQSLIAKEDSDLEPEDLLILMANSDSDVNDDEEDVSFQDIKNNILLYTRKKLISLFGVLMMHIKSFLL